MDEVNRSGIELVITKRGRPVARLVPPAAAANESAFGWLQGTVRELGDIVGPDHESWTDSD
jgi:prevent-host-death family protein